MRIFGKVLQTLRLSRRQPNFKPRRYSSILCSHNSARRTNLHNRNSKHGSIRSMAAKSDSSNKGNDISKTSLSNILPVALIQSATTSTKIVLIPLNMFDGDDDASKNTMKTLSIIREHARQIEAFTENVMGTAESTHYGVPLASNNAGALMDQCSGKDDVTLWTHDEEKSNSHALQPSEETIKSNHISLYEKLERAMAEQERNRIETHDCYEVAAWNSSKRDLVVYVPENLEQKLRQMAIASMQLIFEMDMSNIRDAIFRSAALEKINMFKPPTPKTLEDPTVKIEANLDLRRDETESTIPLDFNAMIQGTVEIDPSKYTPSVLGEIKVPEFNDCVTTIAANICSTALQKGFPADLSRMAYSTKTPAKNKSANRDPHIVCVRDGSKGCISPGNASYPKFKAQDITANTQQAKEKTNKAGISSEIPLLSSSEIINAYNSRGLMSCKAYARALIEATKRRAEIANKSPVQCDDKKSVKKEAFKKKDKCGDTKNNPCTKPLIDECGNELKKNCPTRKKKDKKKDPCKSDDPCKKAASKDEGSCTTPGVPKPCAGKRKKKPTKDKGKKDICGNSKKGNRCNSETDACQQEKKRPKPKKKKCDLGDPCKDPCLNINEKSDKNKKEFSSGKDFECKMVKSLGDMKKSPSSTSGSDKTAKKSKSTSDIKKTDSKCESPKAKKADSSKSKCKPFNSASSKDSDKSKCGSGGKGGKAKNLCDVKKPPPKSATNKECKRYEGFCKSKDSKTSCSSDKDPGKKSNADKSRSKCKPIKSLCDKKKSKSDKKPDCKSESASKSASKCKPIKSLCDAKKSASSDKKSPSKSADCKKDKSSSPKSGAKDHCQTKKKSTKPNCKTKPGSSAKQYSTLANNKSFVEISPIKRYFSTLPVYSIPRGFMSWRQFSSKKSGKGKKKGSKDDGMCMQYQSKPKTKRIDKLERRKPKLDCYSDPDECQEQACKDPMKSSCANIKKGKS
uniref:Uncharacterized protein n=1 Tax=Bactrocera latifrons TaxID=174628 RepID=A0A0K8TVD5_BACLA